MSRPRSAPPRASDATRHPIHIADRRLAEVHAASLAALLAVTAAPTAASLLAIILILVRR